MLLLTSLLRGMYIKSFSLAIFLSLAGLVAISQNTNTANNGLFLTDSSKTYISIYTEEGAGLINIYDGNSTSRTKIGGGFMSLTNTPNNAYGTFLPLNLSQDRTYKLPNNSGIIPLSVNGNLPDSAGNITISPGGTSIVNDADNRVTTALGNGQFNAESNLTFDGLTFSVNGNVGIGTSGSNGYRLAVNGNALFTKIIVKEYSAWPDYVFNNTYKLPSLKYTEDFIKKHSHLPDIPSAEKVKSEGLDLASMQALLLRKVEELTLYAIEQNKKIKILQEEVNILKKRGKIVTKL